MPKTVPSTEMTFKDAAAVILHKITGLNQMIAPIGEPTAIHRIEVPLENIDILKWLEGQGASIKFYFSNRLAETEVGCVGLADTIDDKTDKTISDAFDSMALRFNFLNSNLRFYGGICFDKTKTDHNWKEFGDFKFFIPRFEIRKNREGVTLACNIAYKDVLEEKIKAIQDELKNLMAGSCATTDVLIKPVKRTDAPNKDAWKEEFDRVMQAIKEGSVEKIVLARKSIFEFPETINAFYLKQKLKTLTPECYHFCFQIDPDNIFIGATPERLYRRRGSSLESEAIAGTKVKDTEGIQLTNSSKDLREHRYVVDSIAQSFSKLCHSVNKDIAPSILKLNWGEHLKTNFEGVLKKGVTDNDIIEAIHPTPAVAGYPRQKALEIIRDIEDFSRGWYAGLIGFVGQDEAEFAVAIRSGLIQKNKISLFAAAGIIQGSKAEQEWEEIENKMNNFFKVFQA